MASLRSPAFIGSTVTTNDPCQPNSTIIGSSINVRVNYMSLSRIGDLVATHLTWVPIANMCLPILQPTVIGSRDGSINAKVRVNYRQIARVGDYTAPKFGRILIGGNSVNVRFG